MVDKAQERSARKVCLVYFMSNKKVKKAVGKGLKAVGKGLGFGFKQVNLDQMETW